MAREKTETKKTDKLIIYHKELQQLIPQLGFNSSNEVFKFLFDAGINYLYDRTYTNTGRIEELIKELNEDFGGMDGFIFVMNVPNSINIEVIFIANLSKEEFIRCLKLKAFS